MSKTTIYKAELTLSDLDRHYYQTHTLTLALHPSETEERLMVRLLAFALHADEYLAFGRGLSSENEPDVGLKDATGQWTSWIDVGLPDPKWIKKASRIAKEVFLYVYGGSQAEVWWQQEASAFADLKNVTVIKVPQSATQMLTKICQRSLKLSVTIQQPSVWFATDEGNEEIKLEILKASAGNE
ncbi:YaeQ family protein [Leeia sp. TBRC 13508]|uniref:YaeQ family protein n=1 Tax=Leeia speluncae TaxID=2884804 RepID=A0ABS8DAN5_9NEIS|nr:YaeQ family protein [Leeia speluncae]MCB6185224.1 YaeQ family protein [Leeia speluncae]